MEDAELIESSVDVVVVVVGGRGLEVSEAEFEVGLWVGRQAHADSD